MQNMICLEYTKCDEVIKGPIPEVEKCPPAYDLVDVDYTNFISKGEMDMMEYTINDTKMLKEDKSYKER